MALSFVLVNEGASSPLAAQVTPAWLAQVADACTVQLNRDVSPAWGGTYAVRSTSPGAAVVAGEVVFALVDALPNAPGAVAYHDVTGADVPVAYLALTECSTLADVSIAISHELCETAGDPACNRWADDGAGHEWALELCDAVQERSYSVNGVTVSDFLLPSFFAPAAAGPYSFTGSVGGLDMPGPFRTASGGYQLQRSSGAGETQVDGTVRRMLGKRRHWSSRTYRRGARV